MKPIFTYKSLQSTLFNKCHWFTVLLAACPSKTYLKVCYIDAVRLLKLLYKILYITLYISTNIGYHHMF
jgi:hypothetical protein